MLRVSMGALPEVLLGGDKEDTATAPCGEPLDQLHLLRPQPRETPDLLRPGGTHTADQRQWFTHTPEVLSARRNHLTEAPE